MAKFQGQVITKQGSNLLARALAGEGKFIFTKAAFGNQKHTEHLEDITNLKSLKLNLNVARIFNDDGDVVLTLHITNEHLNEGFLTNEFGIFAKLEGDREEILYSYAVAEEPDSIPANTFGTTYETTTEIYMNFASDVDTDIHVREGAVFLTEPRANEIYVRNEYPAHGNLKSKTQLKADHIYFDDSGNFYLNTGGDRIWNNSATPDNKLIKITFKTIYKWITGIWSKLETKEPIISKKSGFNLDKSDEISLNSSETVATSKAVMTVNNSKVNIAPTQKSANTHSTGLELSVGVAGTLPTGMNHSTPIIINANYNTGYRNQLAMDYNGGCWIRGYNQSKRVETDWQKFWTTQDFDPSTKIDKTSISDSLTSTSTTTVLSSAGAKDLEDKKLNKSGDTMTGHLNIKAGNYSNISLYNEENQKLLIESVPNSDVIGQIVLRKANSYGSEGNLSVLTIPKKSGELAVKSDIDAIENNLKKEITFEVGGEANKYYPVLFSSTNKQCNLTIYRKYNEKAPDTWNTATHKGSLILQLNTNFGNDWDGNPNVAVVNKFDELYSKIASKIMFPNRPGVLIWLRGGGAVYHAFTDDFETNKNLNVEVLLQGYDNPPYHIIGRAGTYSETGAASSIKALYWRDAKADLAHTHDDRYYTEAEVNAKFTAKHLEIVGKDYGGVLNTAGAKTAGKTYWDNNTKKLFLCKNNNSDTSANVANYIALDNNSLLDRLENLFNINNTIFSATMNGFKTVKSSVIKNKTLSIKSINSVDKSSTIYNATLTITGNHTVDVCNGEHKLSFQEQNGEYLIRFYRVNDNFWVYCDNSVVVYL